MINSLVQPNLYDPDLHSDIHAYYSDMPSMTEGSHAEAADINSIVQAYARGIRNFHASPIPPQYGDFTGISDYHSAMNHVIAAQEGFMNLPAELRRQFDNDPGQLIDFLSDPSNRSEAEALGLIAKPDPQLLVPASALQQPSQ